MSKMLQLFIYVIVIFAKLQFVTSDVSDYCTENIFTTNDNSMQFTKEPIINEYGIVGNFKALHCCAKGYRSIEWFKDDRPYPWPDTASKLFLYPQSANQTIHTPSVTAESAGNYTCLLKNDSIVKAHTIKLFVYDKVPDEPKVTYVSSDQEVNFGDTKRLFCEAFLGHVDLPDAHYEATWTKPSRDGDYINENNSRISQEKVSREDNQIFGTYLTISDFAQDDVGLYTCKISKPGRTKEHTIIVREKEVFTKKNNPQEVNWHLVMMIIPLIVLFVAIILCSHLNVRVAIKDRFGRIDNDNKMDILILHSRQDVGVANDFIRRTLEEKYRYKCLTKELPSIVLTNMEITNIPEINECKKILIVLSPNLLNENWKRLSIHQVMKHYYQRYGPNVIYVTLKKIPNGQEAKNSQGESLTSTLSKAMLMTNDTTKSNDKFWLNLRCKLPPNRNNYSLYVNNSSNINFAQVDSNTDNSRRLTNDSLDQFV